MKTRHPGIYFVALWFFVAVAFLIYPLFDYMGAYRGAGQSLPFLVQGLWLLVVLVMVAELVGLIIMHPLSRWFYLLVVSFWTLVIVYNLQQEAGEPPAGLDQVIWSFVFLFVNIATLVYLMRPGIREIWGKQRTRKKLQNADNNTDIISDTSGEMK